MKVVVVGIGSVGRRHIGNLLRLGVDKIVAVSERNKLPSLSIEGTSVDVCHDFDQMLALRPDAVVIANPTSLHLDYLRRTIAAGCNIYLEKPASVSAEGLEALVTEVNRRGLTVAMGTMYRFNERLEALRQRVRRGDIGTPLSAESLIGEHIADYHSGEDYRQSYTARRDLGGGVLLTQIHQIDWLNWVFGPFESVFAAGGQVSDLQIDVEDSVSYILRGGAGFSAYGHLNYLQRPKRAGLTVTGTKGRLQWDLFAHSLSFQAAANDAATEVETSPYDRNRMFLEAMRDFLKSIRTGDAPRTSLQEGLEALVIVDAIKASIRSGQSMRLAA